MHALIIGIEKYQHVKHLEGAVADANKVDLYLREHFKLSRNQIINLRDDGATKKKILGGFRTPSENPHIKRGDPILIYFAGHGCQLPIPKGWETGGAQHIQGIYAQDSQSHPSSEHAIFPVPDLTITSCLNSLSDMKDNNITVIFDCCHSWPA
ncbi:hypothetical protein K439DRAFT_1356446 [Ramaria rubella]|nr:hypothetical protein K439DRAFT_1356446 [Ramaria rubella]